MRGKRKADFSHTPAAGAVSRTDRGGRKPALVPLPPQPFQAGALSPPHGPRAAALGGGVVSRPFSFPPAALNLISSDYHLVGMLSSSCRPTTRHPLTPTTIRQTKTTPASLTSPAPALPTTPPTLSAHLLASLDPTCIQLAEVSTALILPPLHCPSFPGVGSPLFYPMVKAHGFCVAV